MTAIVAVLGTTISPYLFFWQASEEVEEEENNPEEHPLFEAPEEAKGALQRIHYDTIVGMGAATIVFTCIVITAAATLNRTGIHNVETAADAALALRPLAGNFAFLLFALGIVGTGLLAIPVLAGSAAYAAGETMGIVVGLEKTPREAKGFYALISCFTILGLLLNIMDISPMKALYWSAVVNGVAAGPIMVAVMLVSQNPTWMREYAIRGWLRFFGWAAVFVMLSSSVWMFLSMLLKSATP